MTFEEFMKTPLMKRYSLGDEEYTLEAIISDWASEFGSADDEQVVIEKLKEAYNED